MARELVIPTGYPFSGKRLIEIIDQKSLQKRVKEIGYEISNIYIDKTPIIIGVLNGAFLFMADLVRNLNIQFEVDFIKINSYSDNTKSSGTIKLIKDISADIEGRDVIIVEDIVDSGKSLAFLKNRMENSNPRSIKFATCLYKYRIAKLNFNIDWIGFNIEENFFVGYGLDLKQHFRGLPGIYAIKK